MAITQLAPGTPVPRRAGSDAHAAGRVWPGLPVVLGLAVLATVLYSAFAHGAVSRPTATQIELVLAGVSALGALGWLWLGSLRLSAARATVIGAALLAGLACWSGVSVLWSISPDQTWIELNRILTYLLVLGLGVAIGASYRGAFELIAQGYVVVALAVTLYALGQKLLPGLHVSGVFDLNQAGAIPRLQEPLGYWNALALFIAMATPVALALVADRSRGARLRLSAACALALMLMTVPLTYSRGGLIALVVTLIVGVAMSGERLRSLAWLLLSVLASLPAILLGLLMPELSAAHLPLGTREWAGGVLAAMVLGGLVALVLAGRWILRGESRLQIPPERVPTVKRAAMSGAVVLVVALLAALALSNRGFTGEVSHLWNGFAGNQSASNYNPQRLLSTDSYRWLWWKEAADAFGARPLQGWGAGSFPVLHLLYRRNILPVQQPHNVPLQFLAETGLVGAILGVGAFLLLCTGALRAVRSWRGGRERLLAAGLFAAVVAYGVHCLYDWDWNIPALSLPVFLFLGVVAAGAAPSDGAGRSRPTSQAALPGRQGISGGYAVRALALAGAALWLCAFALSVELPALASAQASAAVVTGSGSSANAVRSGGSEAAVASRLDPLSDAGLEVEAAISGPRAGRLYLEQAVARNPSDSRAWQLLAQADSELGDRTAAYAAVQRAIDLDPMGRYGQVVVARDLHQALPSSSATRFPTPAP